MQTTTVAAFGTTAADAPLAPLTIPRREVGPTDVELEILFCGVCHTDLHMTRNHFGYSQFPMVPGHEIVGRVTRVGSAVTRFRAGELAAVSPIVDSCRHCSSCRQSMEVYCLNELTATYGSPDKHLPGHTTYGGYSANIIVDEHFTFRVPTNLDPAAVAPLLCAGVTVWGPLKHWRVGAGSKVGVIGLGGLGHVAIKLAKALGAEVTLFSRTPDKAADARRLGADHVVISTDAAQMQASSTTLDLIIDTVPYNHDVNPYVDTLALDGTLVLVGYLGPLDPAVNAGPLAMRRRSVAGALATGVAEMQEMLDFCGTHHVVSDIELIQMADVNDAFGRLEKGDVKYRFVIDMASLPATA